MASNRLYIVIVVALIIVLSIIGYSAYMSFLPTTTTTTTSSTTISTGPVSINAYWLNTNITLGESVTFIVKTPSSNFTAEIWKVNTPDKLVAEYKGKGGLSQSFTPLERSTYYIKVKLLDETDVWEQQVDYRLKVN